MKNATRLLGIVVAVLGLTAGAGESSLATSTLDFSSGSYTSVDLGSGVIKRVAYAEDGYTINVLPGNHLDSNLEDESLYFHSGGDNTSLNVLTLSKGGSAFDLVSLLVLMNFDGMVFTASSGATQTVSPFTTGIVNFSAGFQNVNSVEIGYFTPFDLFIQLDDVVLDSEPTLSAVPEPSKIALVCTALPMGLGIAWRRRRKAVTA